MGVLRLLFVNTNIVYLKFYRKLRIRGITVGRCTDAEQQAYEVWLTEWILSLPVFVRRFLEVNLVQKYTVNVELDAVRILVHPSHMELLRPVGIVEFGYGLPGNVPLGHPSLRVGPQ